MSAELKSPVSTEVKWDRDARRLRATLVYPIEGITSATVAMQAGDVFVGKTLPDGPPKYPQMVVRLGYYSPTKKRAMALFEEQLDGLDVRETEGGLAVTDARVDTRRLRWNGSLSVPIAAWHLGKHHLIDTLDLGLGQPRCDVLMVPQPYTAIQYDVQTRFGDITAVNAAGNNTNSFQTGSGTVELDDFTGDARVLVKMGRVNAAVRNGDVFVTAPRLGLGEHSIHAQNGIAGLMVGNNNVTVRASTTDGPLDISDDFGVLERHGDNDVTVGAIPSRFRPYVVVHGAQGVNLSRLERNG